MEQLSIFNFNGTPYKPYKIDKPIRLIELFAGVGSQAMALRNIGANFEHYRVVEWDKYAITSYNAIHGTDFPTMDVTKLHGEDLGIVNRKSFTYLLTYLLVSLHVIKRCREDGRHERRFGDCIITLVGSKKTSRRDPRTSTGLIDGECSTGTLTRQHALIPKVD